MKTEGVVVERPIAPSSLQLSTDESKLKDPNAYAVRVRPHFGLMTDPTLSASLLQVVLKHLDAAEGQIDTEVVNAKYVVGTDGRC